MHIKLLNQESNKTRKDVKISNQINKIYIYVCVSRPNDKFAVPIKLQNIYCIHSEDDEAQVETRKGK